MLLFPHAKLNVGLYVRAKRSDGYHEIESLLYPFSCCDVLEVIPSQRTTLRISGLACTPRAKPEENLVWKAYKLLLGTHKLPPISIHLHKCIPIGAGLGGGSSDAAHMLKLLNIRFELGISPQDLAQYAAQLGSDVPFFLNPGAQLAKGRGERLERMPSFLEGTHLYVIVPQLRVSTAEAYKSIFFSATDAPLEEVFKAPRRIWQKRLRNDFQEWLFELHPELQALADTLRAAGAWYVSLSGSGSAVYGLFTAAPAIADMPKNWTFSCIL